MDLQSKLAKNGVESKQGLSAGQASEASIEKHNKLDRGDDGSSGDGKDSMMGKLRGSFDQS